MRAVRTAYDEWTKELPDGELGHPARLYLIDPAGRIREITASRSSMSVRRFSISLPSSAKRGERTGGKRRRTAQNPRLVHRRYRRLLRVSVAG